MDALQTARTYLQQAGAAALAAQADLKDITFKENDSENVLTEADLANSALAHQMLAPFIREGDILIDEESLPTTPVAEILAHPGRVWVIDPIDGTKPYSQGKNTWGILLTIFENGQPIFSGIHMPAMHRWLEITPSGVTLTENGQPVTPATPGTTINISSRAHEIRPIAQSIGLVNEEARSAALMTWNLATGNSAMMAIADRAGFWDIAPVMYLASHRGMPAFFQHAPQNLLTLGAAMLKPDWTLQGLLTITTPEIHSHFPA